MAAIMPEDVTDPAAGTDLYAAAALPDPEGTVTFYTVKKGSRVSRPQPGCHYRTLPGRE
jgi:hypothetical protein